MRTKAAASNTLQSNNSSKVHKGEITQGKRPLKELINPKNGRKSNISSKLKELCPSNQEEADLPKPTISSSRKKEKVSPRVGQSSTKKPPQYPV